MSQTITIYVPTGMQVVSVEGDPPADQSAEVADLTSKLATRTQERDDAIAEVAALTAKLAAAKTEAQQVVDALA